MATQSVAKDKVIQNDAPYYLSRYNIRANKTYSCSLLHYVPYLAEFLLPAGDSKTGQLRIESGARVCPRFAAEYDSFSEYSIWIGASFWMSLSLV